MPVSDSGSTVYTTHSQAHARHLAFLKRAVPSHWDKSGRAIMGAGQLCIPIEIERECVCTKCCSEYAFELVKGDRSRAVTEGQISHGFMRGNPRDDDYKPACGV
jgi:hypothetical protein